MTPEMEKKIAGRMVIAGISSGKDSATLSLWLTEQGIEHRRVHMLTGWDKQEALDYMRGPLARVIGPIEEIRGPLLMADLIRKKGMFPSRLRRFCTEELKVFPLRDFIASLQGDAINAVGIRAEESDKRALMKEWEWSPALDSEVWRPLLRFTFEDVVATHRRHGLAPNPLYLWGAERVGCWPCIFARKNEIRLVAERDPARISEIAALEAELTERAGDGRFFFHGKTGRNSLVQIGKVVEWARTGKGGRQFELLEAESDAGCVRWGLCDAGAAP